MNEKLSLIWVTKIIFLSNNMAKSSNGNRLRNHTLFSVIVLVLPKCNHSVVIGIKVFKSWEHGWIGLGVELEVFSLVLFEFQSRHLVVAVGIGLTELISQLLDSGGLDVFLELCVLHLEVGHILDVSLVKPLLLHSRDLFGLFGCTPRMELCAQEPTTGTDYDVFHHWRSRVVRKKKTFNKENEQARETTGILKQYMKIQCLLCEVDSGTRLENYFGVGQCVRRECDNGLVWIRSY